MHRPSRLALICTALAVTLVGLTLLGAPLGHDEASYAVGGRMLVEGDGGYYWPHRSVGMQYVAAIPAWLDGGDRVMRSFAIAFSLVLACVIWWCAKRAYNAATATWTTALVASSYVILRRGFMLETDVPSAILVITCVGLIVTRLGDGVGHAAGANPDRRRWSLVWLGPLAAASFYMRYGSAPVLASIAISATIVYRARLRAQLVPLAVAALAFAACLIPHALHSIVIGGDPMYILRTAHEVVAPNSRYFGEGVVYYATHWWFQIGFVAPVMIAGLAALVTRRLAWSRETAFFALSALLALVALGVMAHGEARYGLIPMILLTAVGVEALRVVSRGRGQAMQPGLRIAALVAVVAVWLFSLRLSVVRVRTQERHFRGRVLAGALIRSDSFGQPCFVDARRTPQIAWYSGCRPVTDWMVMPAARYVLVEAGDPDPTDLVFVGEVPKVGEVGGERVYRTR